MTAHVVRSVSLLTTDNKMPRCGWVQRGAWETDKQRGGSCRSDGRTIFAIMGSRLNDLNALPAVDRQGIASFTTNSPRRVGRYKLDKNGKTTLCSANPPYKTTALACGFRSSSET